MNDYLKPENNFDLFMRKHLSLVSAFIQTHEFNRDTVQDITADVFELAFRNSDSLSPLSDDLQRAWLIKVARNLLANHGRKMKTRRKTMVRLANEPIVVSELLQDPFYLHSAVNEDFSKSTNLCAAIHSLSPKDSKVLLLHANGGSGREIARAFGVSESAARKILMRARQQLQVAYLQVCAPHANSGENS